MGRTGTHIFTPAAFEVEAKQDNGYVGSVILRSSEAGGTSGEAIPPGARIDGVEVYTPIFADDPIDYDMEGASHKVHLVSRVGGVEEIIAGGKTFVSDEDVLGGPTDRWGGAVCLSQPEWIADPSIAIVIDTNGAQGGPQRERAESSDTGQISIYWRKADMRVTADACYGIEKCAALFDALFNGFGRVSIGLIGDSTVGHSAYGWDTGWHLALKEMGINPYGSGLHGCGEDSGVGYAVQNSPNTQNGTYTSLPSEWQAWAQNKSGNSGYLGVLDTWLITSNQAGGNFGFFVNGQAEFVKEALSYKLWYATTTANTSGSSMKIHARKQMASTGYHLVQIENFDPSVTNTFKLVIAGTPTADITVPTYATAGSAGAIATAVNASVKSAVEAVAGSTVSVSATATYLGYLSFLITRSTGADLGTVTVDTEGMRPRFCGREVTTRVHVVASGSGGYSTIGSQDTIDADQQASTAVAVYERSIASNASRDFDIGVIPNYSSGNTALAPMLLMFNGVTAPGRTKGFDVTPIVSIGGNPTRIHATRLQNQTDEFLTAFFAAWAGHAGYSSPSTHRRLLMIHDGLNDQNDSTNSVGASPAAGNTRAGVLDNLLAIANRLDGIHDLNGWSKANLGYVVVLPQPQTSSDSNLTFYRLGAKDFVARHPRACLVDLAKLHGGYSTDVTELMGWTGADNDASHPHAMGFRVWARQALESIKAAMTVGRAPLSRLEARPLRTGRR